MVQAFSKTLPTTTQRQLALVFLKGDCWSHSIPPFKVLPPLYFVLIMLITFQFIYSARVEQGLHTMQATFSVSAWMHTGPVHMNCYPTKWGWNCRNQASTSLSIYTKAHTGGCQVKKGREGVLTTPPSSYCRTILSEYTHKHTPGLRLQGLKVRLPSLW